jgi:hypothetical protein
MNKNLKIFIFCLLFFQFSLKTIAQNKGTEEDKNRLYYLNSLYLQAYIRSDTATFNQLLWADDFTQTNPDGTVLSRKENAIRFAKPRFDKIVYFYGDNIKIIFPAIDKAIISVRNPSCLIVNGKLEKSVSWCKDTYIISKGFWKCESAIIMDSPF